MAYSPAFQYYYKDFRQDPNTIRMTTLEIGAYWLLINECWDRDNRLPKNTQDLADIAKLPVDQFEVLWTRAIKRCFKEKKTFFWHKRLAEEILKQKEWKNKFSRSGKLGALKRWEDKDLQNGVAIASPSSSMATYGSSSSSSSSSSKKKKEKPSVNTEGEKKATPPPPPPKSEDEKIQLPRNYELSPEHYAWAIEHVPNVNIQLELPEFITYWRDMRSDNTRRTLRGWYQTWQNRMKVLEERFEEKHGKSRQNHLQKSTGSNGDRTAGDRTAAANKSHADAERGRDYSQFQGLDPITEFGEPTKRR